LQPSFLNEDRDDIFMPKPALLWQMVLSSSQ
jgi:hypothetical protein